MCGCVCVCVCARARARVRACVCVCVCLRVCVRVSEWVGGWVGVVGVCSQKFSKLTKGLHSDDCHSSRCVPELNGVRVNTFQIPNTRPTKGRRKGVKAQSY